MPGFTFYPETETRKRTGFSFYPDSVLEEPLEPEFDLSVLEQERVADTEENPIGIQQNLSSGVYKFPFKADELIDDVVGGAKRIGANILELMATGRGAEVLGKPEPLGVDVFSPFRAPIKEFGAPDPRQQTLAEQLEGVITGGIEKWREATVPTRLAEVKPYSIEEVGTIVSNIGKGLSSVARLGIDIHEQIFLDEEGRPRGGSDIVKSAKAVGIDFAAFPLTVFRDYALYLSPLSTQEQRRGAVERIYEHPEGLPFALGIARGGIKGGRRFYKKVKRVAEKYAKIPEGGIFPRAVEPAGLTDAAIERLLEKEVVPLEKPAPKKIVIGEKELALQKKLKAEGVGEAKPKFKTYEEAQEAIDTRIDQLMAEGKSFKEADSAPDVVRMFEARNKIAQAEHAAGYSELTEKVNKVTGDPALTKKILDDAYSMKPGELGPYFTAEYTAERVSSGRGMKDALRHVATDIAKREHKFKLEVNELDVLFSDVSPLTEAGKANLLKEAAQKTEAINKVIEDFVFPKGEVKVIEPPPAPAGKPAKVEVKLPTYTGKPGYTDVALEFGKEHRGDVKVAAALRTKIKEVTEEAKTFKQQVGELAKDDPARVEILDKGLEKANEHQFFREALEELEKPAEAGKAAIPETDLKTTANEMLNDAKYIKAPRVAKGTPATGVQVDYSAAAPDWYVRMRSGTGMGKAETLTGLQAIIKDGAATKNVHGQRLLSYVEEWAQRKPGKGAGEMVAAEFKAGDRVRIGDEWYEAKVNDKTGEVKLIDSQSVTMDVFDKVTVDEFRPVSVAPRPTKQSELLGLQRAEAEAITGRKIKKVTGTKAIKEEMLGRPEGEVLPGQKELGIKRTVSEKLDTAEKRAYERIKKRGTRLTTGIDPAEMADLAIIGAAKIGRGTIKFADWSAEMVREFGDRVKPHLKTIYARSQKETPRLRANAELDSFIDYYEEIQAPVEFRPPRKPARSAIRTRLREEGLRGEELTSATNAEFIKATQDYGIALRTTRAGKVQPAIREAGTYVPEDFATYGEFKDAKAGGFGGTKDAVRFVQEIDGALSVEAKAKVPGQAGPAERYVSWRTHDIHTAKIRWASAMKSRLKAITEGLSKKQLKVANQIIEHISREGAYVDPAELGTNLKISTLTTDLKVIRFAQEGRKLYESLLRHQNEFRRLIGRKEIRHRNYYTPHSIHKTTIWERALGHDKTPEQLIGPGLPDYIKPNAPFNARALARKVGLEENVREMDLKLLLERYIETAAKDIYDTAIIQNNKAFIQQLESMGYEHAARGLESWTAESFAGVRGALDRTANLSPIVHKGMSLYRRGLLRSVFPLNFRWNAFVQTSSGILTVTRYGYRNSIKGMYDWFSNKKLRQDIADNAYSAIIKGQRSGRISRQDINSGITAAERLDRGKLEKVTDAANFFTEWVERNLTGWSVATAKRHGASVGLQGKALWEYASDGGAKTQSMYNLESLPGMLRSEVVKTTNPFQTFSFEVFNTLREFAGKTGTPPATTAIRIKMALRFLAGATAVNLIGQAAVGRKPWELSSFIPFYGTFIAPISSALRGEDVSMVTTRGLPSPVGIGIKGGQAVYEGLLVPGYAGTRELVRTGKLNAALEEFMATGKWSKLRRFTIRYLSGFAGVPGGTQLNRIVDGLIAASAGGMVDASGRMMFPITDTKNKIRTFLGGPWATEGGQEYWDKRGGQLNLDIEYLEENPMLRDVLESLPVAGDFVRFAKEGESQTRQDIRRMIRTGDTEGAQQKRSEWNAENPSDRISEDWYDDVVSGKSEIMNEVKRMITVGKISQAEEKMHEWNAGHRRDRIKRNWYDKLVSEKELMER